MAKVCIITVAHRPFDTRIFHRQAKTLAKAGHDVTLIAPHNQNEVIDGIKILAISKPKNRFSRISTLAWHVFRLALNQKAEIYHFHDPELIPVGVALKLFGRRRVVYDIHEEFPEQILSKTWIPLRLRKPAALAMIGLEKFAAHIFDGLVAATPVIARRFPPHKTVVVRNFPILEEFNFPETEQLYSERPPWAVYIGGISAIRGAVEMVKAIDRVNTEAELVWAGFFKSDDLQERLKKLPGWKRTRFVGWLNRSQIRDLLSQARVGLVLLAPLLRFQRSFPIKLFEYMAAGIPFVASDFPVWREIGEGAGLFVDPLDPDAIARAINWLLSHPVEAYKMGKRGRQLVENRYRWDHEAERLLSLYAKLVENKI